MPYPCALLRQINIIFKILTFLEEGVGEVLLLMITKDIIPIFNTDTFLEGIKSDSNVSMYEIKSPEYNSCGPFPPTPCAVVETLRLGIF